MSNSRERRGGPPFYGKYSGTVVSNVDTEGLGRITAMVPAVFGAVPSGPALPSMPFAGAGMGFFAVPQVGASVWIEFEDGHPNHPIWSGCFWKMKADVPPTVVSFLQVLIQTTGMNSILIDDTPGVGGITLTTVTGQKLTMNAQGITLQNSDGAKLQIATGQGITLQDATGNSLALAPQGATLQTVAGASVELQGPTVAINKEALKVVP